MAGQRHRSHVARRRNRPEPIHRLVGDGFVGADGDQPGQSRRIVGPILNHHSTRKPSYFMQDLL
jgi:hypothetical protein